MSSKKLAEIIAPEAAENLQFIAKSVEAANAHEWLYHCTSVDALLNIIKSHEMWLSTLKNVNDHEEANRIDDPEFEKAYYIASFTYDPDIPLEHWDEYGKSKESVLFGMRKEWFTDERHFVFEYKSLEKQKALQIVNSSAEATPKDENNITYFPYYVFDHAFYQIVYDDALIKKMSSQGLLNGNNCQSQGTVITPGLPGIIKATHGISKREGQPDRDKNWESEKEVRLKIGVKTYNPASSNCPERLAVKLSDTAFSELPIRFSPDMSEKQKKQSMKQIQEAIQKFVSDAHIYEI